MEKDFNTGLRRSLESDRIKLIRRRKQLLREMGYSEDLDSAELAEKLHEQVRANDVLNRSITRQEEEIKKLGGQKGHPAGVCPVCGKALDMDYASVASVIQTAVKNGQNPFEVLRVIATLALA